MALLNYALLGKVFRSADETFSLQEKIKKKIKTKQKGGGSRVVLHLHGFMVYLKSGVLCMLSNFVGLLNLARMLLERMWAGDRKQEYYGEITLTLLTRIISIIIVLPIVPSIHSR